jgi:hypothetical protein
VGARKRGRAAHDVLPRLHQSVREQSRFEVHRRRCQIAFASALVILPARARLETAEATSANARLDVTTRARAGLPAIR